MAKGSSNNHSKGSSSKTSVSALGFKETGIAAASRGAQFMSSTAQQSGGGVSKGSTVSTLQHLGATGQGST